MPYVSNLQRFYAGTVRNLANSRTYEVLTVSQNEITIVMVEVNIACIIGTTEVFTNASDIEWAHPILLKTCTPLKALILKSVFPIKSSYIYI